MSMIRFKPTGERILVQAVHAAPVVKGIFLPETAKEQKPAEAVVVAIGPHNKLPVLVGNRVLTERYNGTDIRIGDQPFRLLEPRDVLAVLEEGV